MGDMPDLSLGGPRPPRRVTTNTGRAAESQAQTRRHSGLSRPLVEPQEGPSPHDYPPAFSHCSFTCDSVPSSIL
eukprot:9366263-Pyramimonas_sp.AAC.1